MCVQVTSIKPSYLNKKKTRAFVMYCIFYGQVLLRHKMMYGTHIDRPEKRDRTHVEFLRQRIVSLSQ